MALLSTAKKVATGLLDMDTSSRIARAKEQGYSWANPLELESIGYSTKVITNGSPEAVKFSKYLSEKGIPHKSHKAKTGSTYITLEGNPYTTNKGITSLGDLEYRFSDHSKDKYKKLFNNQKVDNLFEADVFPNGHTLEDAIRKVESTGGIRSVDAAFDPAKISSSNLLASNPVATAAAGAGGLLAVTGSEDADAGVVGKSLDNIIKAANKQGVKLDVFENKKKGGLELSRIVVPEKSKGVGTSIMNDLAEYADKTGQTVSLSPSTDFGGTSKRRLTEFYKRFGFVQNKGKNKDYTISNSMYRSPSIKSSNPVATTGAGLMANVTGQPSNLSSYMQGNTDAYLTNAERQYLQNKQAFESNFSDDTGWDRADILPFRVNEQTGEREFATPEMIKGLLSGLYDIGQSKNTKISNPASLLELI